MPAYTVGVECAIEYKGQFLIIRRPAGKHAAGVLAFPGGGVEPGDGQSGDVLQAAAKREVFEEVGITLTDSINYVTSSYFIDDFGKQVIHCVFHCIITSERPDVTATPAEVPEYHWMSAQEIRQAEHAPEWLRRWIELYFSGAANAFARAGQ